MISFKDGVLSVNADFKSISKLIYKVCLTLYIVFTFAFAQYKAISPALGCVVFAAAILVLIANGNKNIAVPTVTIWYAIMVVYCAVSLIWTENDITESFKYIIRMIIICMVMTSVSLYVYDEKDFDGILSVFILSIFIVTALEYSSVPAGELFSGEVGSYFSDENKNIVAFWVMSALVISFYKAYFKNSKICWLLSAYFLFFVVIGGSRKAILMSAIGVFAMVIMAYRKKRYVLRILLFVVLAAVLFIIIMTNEDAYNTIGRRIFSMYNQYTSDGVIYDNSIYLREYYMAVAKELFEQSPILGKGLGSFSHHLYYNYNSASTYSHNNYWQILSELGIVGIILYYWFYAFCLIKSAKRFFAEKNDTAILALTFFLLFFIGEYAMITIFSKQFQIVVAIAFCATYIEKQDARQYRYLQR
ncbi:MAG: O-antigen ligase family protein [Clostridia bacterium]|nr:O-antigen ligase family protein [Clostridia bacterium]